MEKLFLLSWLAFLYARMTNGSCFCFLYFLKYFPNTLKCFPFPQDFFPYHNRAKKVIPDHGLQFCHFCTDWKKTTKN